MNYTSGVENSNFSLGHALWHFKMFNFFFFLNQLKHQMTLRCILMFITCPKILKNIIRWLCVKDLLLHTCWLWSVKLFINVSPWDLHSDLADTFPNSLRIKCFLFTTKFIVLAVYQIKFICCIFWFLSSLLFISFCIRSSTEQITRWGALNFY